MEMAAEHWPDLLRSKLESYFYMTRCVIEGMREREFGRIINIGPIKDQVAHSAKIGQVTPGSTIHGFTRVLAQQTAARGITVNAISSGYVPGAVATQTGTKNNTKVNIDKSRLCSALDIARGGAVFSSRECGFYYRVNAVDYRWATNQKEFNLSLIPRNFKCLMNHRSKERTESSARRWRRPAATCRHWIWVWRPWTGYCTSQSHLKNACS